MSEVKTGFLLNPEHQSPEARQNLKKTFDEALPYRHLVIDDFLKPELAKELSQDFPSKEALSIHWNGLNERKSEGSNWEKFAPIFEDLHNTLNSPEFYKWMSDVTGIEDVFITEDNMGAGLHLGETGSFLDVHVDFNMNTKFNVYRRLNLLIYLNEGWQDDWGGNLEMWDAKMTKCEKKVSPKMNRCVIFETSDFSYHGYDKITCPEDQKRKSVYGYYYTKDHPDPKAKRYFDTTFKARPEEGTAKRIKTDVKEGLKNFVKRNLKRLGIKVYKI